MTRAERLDGWKSIAEHLKRTTRTVQRWEKLEGLPVHRIGHTTSSSVFAYPDELDGWWNERKTRLDTQDSSRENAIVEPLGSPPGIADERSSSTQSRRHGRILVLAGLPAITGVLVLLFFWPRARFTNADVTTPIGHGDVEMVAISPDGRKLVYSSDMNRQHTLTIHDLASGEERTLLQGTYSRYFGMTFSRDGAALYFTGQVAGTGSSLYRISVAGGAEVKVLDGINSPVTFSPGGEKIAFVREAGESQLVVGNLDGSGQRPILSRRLPEYLDYPAWSPDGKAIVATSISGEGGRLIAVDPESGNQQPVGSQAWNFLRFPVWLDGRTLAVSARGTRRANERLFRISYPDGKAEPLVLPGDKFVTLSASRDGRSLAGVTRGINASLWTVEGSAEPREILPSVSGTRGIAWNSDGRLLFGPIGIHSVKADGTDLTRLLTGIELSSFAVCGTNQVVYARTDTPNVGLWKSVLAEGTSRMLVASSAEAKPRCSPDGQWLVYSERWSPAYQVGIRGGGRQVLISDNVLHPVVSWDNQWIAAYHGKSESTWQEPFEIGIYPRRGGAPVRTLPLAPSDFDWTPLRWTPDNQAIGYIEQQGGIANLWVQPLDGSPRRQLTHFQGGRVIDFEWSRDGRLAFEFGTMARQIYLVRER